MNEKHNLIFIYFNQVCMVCFPGLVHESRLTVYYFIFSKTRGKAPAGVCFLVCVTGGHLRTCSNRFRRKRLFGFVFCFVFVCSIGFQALVVRGR